MSQEHQLIGRWSADDIYGPGAQSDEILVFLANGQGVFEVLNFGLCSYDVFEWSIASNVLTIRGIKSVSRDDVENIVESISHFVLENVSFTVNHEDTPRGIRQEVLTIAAPAWLPDKYARMATDVSGYVLPRF